VLHGSQQAGSQQAGSQQAGSQQAGCAQQVGSGAQQDDSQQLDWQQPPLPSMRFRSSKPKLWLQKLMLTTSAPKNMFHFIEQRLLYRELRVACGPKQANAIGGTDR
jgi:hypothetical protein